VDDRQLRAVIRAALRANGFDVRMSELGAAERQTRVLGLRLRDLLLDHLPGFAARADIARLAQQDSFVWNRLPSMLAFGHQQAVVFRRLMHPDKRSPSAASLLPVATFSAGISLLDYLADAAGMAAPIYEVLDDATVAGLFGGGPAQDRLREGYDKTADVRLRLLLALVAACGAGISALLRASGDTDGRRDLLATFAALHGAQRAVTFHGRDPAAAGAGDMGAVVTKSVLPFVAAHQIVELFSPPGTAKRAGRELARRIGQAVALTDDLVDLLADWQTRTPNTLIGWAGGTGGAGGPRTGADGRLAEDWLYRVAGQTAERIVDTLRSAALLYPAHPPNRSDRPAGASLTAAEAAAKFATLTVARWVGWRAELSPPSVFAQRRRQWTAAGTGRPAAHATAALLREQRGGYPEAVHWMTVPRLAEAGQADPADRAGVVSQAGAEGVRLQVHPAIVFQRAAVLDSLLDAYAAGLDVPGRVLAREALLLLYTKRQDVRGGWSYLSGVPELPPDVDDLAMVAQVLARCGGPPLAAACDEAFSLVFDAAERDRTLSTWILDPRDSPARNAGFRRYIELTQAGGTHPDVVANFLYAVGLRASEAGRRRVEGAIPYLEAAQDTDGSWPSRWYWGRLYGTFRAVLALTQLAPGSGALGRARDFLATTQHADGGWGADGRSDPLSTAFATLALAALAQPGTGRGRHAAVAYLLATQEPGGGWPGCPFIAFPRVGGPGFHVYRSATITTSFCLKALLACGGVRPAGRRTAIAYREESAPPTSQDWS
jgi:hypothetical protein